MRALIAVALLCAASLAAQPQAAKRILYITHSAGFRHGSIEHSIEVLKELAAEAGPMELTATEDVSRINAANLANYDAILFFTSGELPIGDQQKADLLNFVRSGKGFGGFHSATDTFYTWPEYGEMIGGYFNGHPWTEEVEVIREAGQIPHDFGGPEVRFTDEIYQFRNFSRDRVRVLFRLNPATVDLNAPGVNPNTDDFPLAWTRAYGEGRVFYSALGHFDEVWDHPGYKGFLARALAWLAGLPQFQADWVGNAADFFRAGSLAPGTAFTIYGNNLTTGGTAAASASQPALELAGASLEVDGERVPLYYASPGQINGYLPLDRTRNGSQVPGFLFVAVAGGYRSDDAYVLLRDATPGIFTTTRQGNFVTFWGTGFGAVERRGELDWLVEPAASNGAVLFAGLSPGTLGLYQVNVEMPPGTVFPADVRLTVGGRTFEARVE